MDSTPVKVNVGGKIFTTTRGTLQKAKYFSELALEPDLSNVLIDRSPDTFDYILNCLRDSRYITAERLQECQLELDYFGIDCLKARLKSQEVVIAVADDSPFTVAIYLSGPYLVSKAALSFTKGQVLDTKITIQLPYSGYVEVAGHHIYHGFTNRFYPTGKLSLTMFRAESVPAGTALALLSFHRSVKVTVQK